MPRPYIRKAILKELDNLAKGYCEYCKCIEDYIPGRNAIEHIIPIKLGGSSELENLAKACDACNGSKHIATTAHDPVTNQIVSLFHPRKNKWNNHFKWSKDLLKMEGITPIGRATIIRLKTNRIETVNLRSILIGHGHPPN